MNVRNVGTRVLNQYLIQLEQGYLLIDTGYPGGFPAFEHRLSRQGIAVTDITDILLTHAHDDHAGFLNEVLDQTSAKVALHPLAVSQLRQGHNAFEGGCSDRLARWFCRILAWMGKGEHTFPVVDRPDRYIVLDETTIPALEERWNATILFLPGHTKDSIGLLTRDGHLFCGDAAMNNLPSRHRITIWMEDKDAFRQSWDTMLESAPKVILPGHGKPFDPQDLVRYRDQISKRQLHPLQ